MNSAETYDVLVLGSGTAGKLTAWTTPDSRKLGLRVLGQDGPVFRSSTRRLPSIEESCDPCPVEERLLSIYVSAIGGDRGRRDGPR
jgi:hypothetical protein